MSIPVLTAPLLDPGAARERLELPEGLSLAEIVSQALPGLLAEDRAQLRVMLVSPTGAAVIEPRRQRDRNARILKDPERLSAVPSPCAGLTAAAGQRSQDYRGVRGRDLFRDQVRLSATLDRQIQTELLGQLQSVQDIRASMRFDANRQFPVNRAKQNLKNFSVFCAQ